MRGLFGAAGAGEIVRPRRLAGVVPRPLSFTVRGRGTMRSLLVAIILSAMVSGAFAHDYAVGQVWTYHVRPADAGSTLQINKIEKDPKLGTIYHISVFDLRIASPIAPGGFIRELPHLPVSQQTLDKSVESLMPQPARAVDYAPGYGAWRLAFDAGRGGIYTISVAEIIDLLAQSMGARSQ